MQLPGRLKSTSLGDLLGTIHRADSTGTLELAEPQGRVHRVYFTRGRVSAVELDRASASLAELLRRAESVDEDTLRRSLLRAMASRRLHGEVLVRDFRIDPAVVDEALRVQIRHRLQILEQLADAQIAFRVTVRPPRSALAEQPLGARDFLHGRARARDRVHAAASETRIAIGGRDTSTRALALRALGLPPGAADPDIKRAYRALVRAYHPDLHPLATDEERRALGARFAEVAAAYKSLVA